MSGNAQEQAVEDAAAEAEQESVESAIEHIEAIEAEGPRTADTQEVIDEVPNPVRPPPGASRSNYTNTVPSLGGQKSVDAELIEADTQKNALWDIDWTHKYLKRMYDGKERLNTASRIAFSVDYSFLAQQASFSTADKKGASDVFRIYGSWLAVGDKSKTNGNLVFKYEHRAAIWGRPTPRDMGFTTGSALSTANYKENGWGWTDLYWKQNFNGGKATILLGHMDPGDWADQHSLLNAWTNLLNDSFYNNPAEAIPKRTSSIVGRMGFDNNWYGAAGIHDANGKDNHLDFRQVWDTPELFTWVEVGRRSENYTGFGETTHLHYWHQDERVAAAVGESWGLTASKSQVHDSGYTTVVRLGYSVRKAR